MFIFFCISPPPAGRYRFWDLKTISQNAIAEHQKNRTRIYNSAVKIIKKWQFVCKPGFVVYNHLSRLRVAPKLEPPFNAECRADTDSAHQPALHRIGFT